MKQDTVKRFTRRLACLLAFLLLSSAQAVELTLPGSACDDQVCPIPTVNENNQPVYAMVSPVGYHAVDMIEQAPRLDTLEGKKIALVGGSFMAAVTHAELKRCILEKYPTAEIFF